MSVLIAFTGFGGAGKTTAIEYFQERSLGRRVYLGQVVHDEIRNLGLTHSPEAERDVRLALRSRLGRGAFAEMRAKDIASLLAEGINPLVDSIFTPEEHKAIWTEIQAKTVLIAIHAAFETRSQRLLARTNRTHTSEELRERDQTELVELRIQKVLDIADLRVVNEGSIDEYRSNLDKVWGQITS